MKVIILIAFYATFLTKNAESVGENGERPKLNKTFDEIFGKGWDAEVPEFTETKEWHKKETQTTEVENKSTDQPNPNEQSFSDHYESFANRKIRERFDEMFDENWSEDENNSAPSPDDLDQENSKKHFSDQNNSTDQDESVGEQQNESNECEKIESDQQKREIIQKFREIKNNYKKKRKYSRKEWNQINRNISNVLGVGRSTIYKWSKELGLKKETKSKFSELEKLEILKQFDAIKSKCKKAKIKSGSKNELDKKIAKKLGVCCGSIYEWKRKFGRSVSIKKFSDATKIGILKKYAKIKGKNPKMTDCDIADLLKISRRSLGRWKSQFKKEIKNL